MRQVLCLSLSRADGLLVGVMWVMRVLLYGRNVLAGLSAAAGTSAEGWASSIRACVIMAGVKDANLAELLHHWIPGSAGISLIQQLCMARAAARLQPGDCSDHAPDLSLMYHLQRYAAL